MPARRFALLVLFISVAVAVSCSAGTDTGDRSRGVPQPNAGTGASSGVEILDDAGGIHIGAFSVSPANPAFVATVENGVVTKVTDAQGANVPLPLKFRALDENGKPVSAEWSLDKGEFARIDTASGELTPLGIYAGKFKVIATAGTAFADTEVTLELRIVQNGAPADANPPVGRGGWGGVGGEGLGGAVDENTRAKLRGAGTSPADLSLLYPYDRTVWPRGVLAPLLQWTATRRATAVYIRLRQNGWEFEGFYSGTSMARHPIEPNAWKGALASNQGDELELELKLTDGTEVWGPLSAKWIVAPGVLKGTIYYTSYGTAYTKWETGRGASILSIPSGAHEPSLVIAGSEKQCIACHTVSEDGSKLFAQWTSHGGAEDSAGRSYDLRNNAAPLHDYPGVDMREPGLSRDGTFALQSACDKWGFPGGAEPWAVEWMRPIHTGEWGNKEVFTRFVSTVDASLLGTRAELPLSTTGDHQGSFQAVTPVFSPAGDKLALNLWYGGTIAQPSTTLSQKNGHTLDLFSFSCTPGTSAVPGAPSCTSFSLTNQVRLYENGAHYPGYPAWLPNGKGIVFHNRVGWDSTVSKSEPGPLDTRYGAKAEIWYVNVEGTPQPIRLANLNGVGYLPVGPKHLDDYQMNYEPTVNPIVSGGYAWVVFTSRRLYGNVATGDPYNSADPDLDEPILKKLWVAAIDLNAPPGTDPSHPAFYLPGQEMNAGNMRGFWAVDPCRDLGNSCETGDECCSGFCRADATGTFVCSAKPNDCAQEYERCEHDSDCCGHEDPSGLRCINERCSFPAPTVVR